MPPKKKDANKKLQHPSLIRPVVSESSLLVVPEDAIEGYQERIETGIEWTLIEEAARHHKKKCMQQDIFPCTFAKALRYKLENSIFGGFLDEKSIMSLDQYWETILNSSFWEQDKFSNDAEKICFLAKNVITDDIVRIVKKAVRLGDRKVLWKELKNVEVLRINNAEITNLDKSLLQYEKLVNLFLCGNFIKSIEIYNFPEMLRIIELQANGITKVDSFTKHFRNIYYLGLARNLLCDESVSGLAFLPQNLTILDLGDNDIYDLVPVLDALLILPTLISLTLAGNPCSVCAAYSFATLRALPSLKWLDNRKVLKTDLEPPPLPKQQPIELHPDDFLSAYFFFKVIRIMSTPQPPKTDKGATGTFHVELEIPLLDSKRRHFLMYRDNEFLVEYPPEPEEGWSESELTRLPTANRLTTTEIAQEETNATDIYELLEEKDNNIILNYKVFESNRIQWHNVMTFTDPIIRIFCPDLIALRDTFRTVITIRFVYTLTFSAKTTKDKTQIAKPPPEYRVVIAEVKCSLRRPDWSQKAQHFHWDDSMKTNDAIHWGDGDLEILQYISPQTKVPKSPKETDQIPKQQPPHNLTCHFSFGIETMQTLR